VSVDAVFAEPEIVGGLVNGAGDTDGLGVGVGVVVGVGVGTTTTGTTTVFAAHRRSTVAPRVAVTLTVRYVPASAAAIV
jgi:hypothetical protein